MKLKIPTNIKFPTGNAEVSDVLTLNSLDYAVTYNNRAKTCTVTFEPIGKKLVIWEGDAYTAAGQFTDEDVDKRILEVLDLDDNLVKKLIPLQVHV